MLQWGHDLAVMESWVEVEDDRWTLLLQWGHDLAVMERTPFCACDRSYNAASIGAMTSRSWRGFRPLRPLHPSARSFNGAMTSRSWRVADGHQGYTTQ